MTTITERLKQLREWRQVMVVASNDGYRGATQRATTMMAVIAIDQELDRLLEKKAQADNRPK